MHATSYQSNIYPFQNELLALVQGANADFYLTGGTALSRFYLNHRYSDDLVFPKLSDFQVCRRYKEDCCFAIVVYAERHLTQ